MPILHILPPPLIPSPAAFMGRKLVVLMPGFLLSFTLEQQMFRQIWSRWNILRFCSNERLKQKYGVKSDTRTETTFK